MPNVLITGAGGFLGQALASALLASPRGPSFITLTDINLPRDPSSGAQNVRIIQADISAPNTCHSLFDPVPDVVFILHGIMSSGAEANLELGLKVNLDSVRILLDRLRALNPLTRVVFTSSLAVYGPPPAGLAVDEFNTVPYPRSSYGTEKLMVETLLSDYSRRGLLDACTVRLPTVVVRPGAPTAAASSFASGIIREPLKGEQSILPIDPATKMWICSPETVVANLIHAMEVPRKAFGESMRTVNVPGVTVTVMEMLQALEDVAGKAVRELVVHERDPEIEKIVESWPAMFNTARAKQLGFKEDISFVETVRRYIGKEVGVNGH
jgi:nucleoside-diphosphate-sugar epimerase